MILHISRHTSLVFFCVCLDKKKKKLVNKARDSVVENTSWSILKKEKTSDHQMWSIHTHISQEKANYAFIDIPTSYWRSWHMKKKENNRSLSVVFLLHLRISSCELNIYIDWLHMTCAFFDKSLSDHADEVRLFEISIHRPEILCT